MNESVRVEVREQDGSVLLWLGTNAGALQGLRAIIAALAAGETRRLDLADVEHLENRENVSMSFELVERSKNVWPVVRGDLPKGFSVTGDKVAWEQALGLLDGVILGDGPGFQWLTDGSPGPAIVVERTR
jgi:hypothetical protein